MKNHSLGAEKMKERKKDKKIKLYNLNSPIEIPKTKAKPSTPRS